MYTAAELHAGRPISSSEVVLAELLFAVSKQDIARRVD